MGLYAITLSTIQRLRREHWGAKTTLDKLRNEQSVDSGVQAFCDELAFALADNSATQLPETWKLVAPANGPSIQINQGDNVDGGITIVNNINEEVTLNFETINNITEIVDVATSGFSGNVTIPTSFTVNVSGCTATITVATVQTLSFSNGLLTGVA